MLEIGVLCAHKLCGIKTFLPFVCEFCGKSFCDEHRNHGCALQQATLIKCASCKRNLRVGPGVDQDRVLAEHLASGKCIQKKEKRRRRCKAKHCREILLVPFRCGSCDQAFCASHRTPESHKCKGRESNSFAGAKYQSSAALRDTAASLRCCGSNDREE